MDECPHGYPATDAHRCAICRRNGLAQLPTTTTAVMDWDTAARHAIIELAGSGRMFTSEDVTDICGLPNASTANANNRVGALVQAQARRLGLRRVGWEKARNPQANGRLLAVWRKQ